MHERNSSRRAQGAPGLSVPHTTRHRVQWSCLPGWPGALTSPQSRRKPLFFPWFLPCLWRKNSQKTLVQPIDNNIFITNKGNRNQSDVLKEKGAVLKRENAGNEQKIRILILLPGAVQNNHSCLPASASLFREHTWRMQSQVLVQSPHFHTSTKLQGQTLVGARSQPCSGTPRGGWATAQLNPAWGHHPRSGNQRREPQVA